MPILLKLFTNLLLALEGIVTPPTPAPNSYAEALTHPCDCI